MIPAISLFISADAEGPSYHAKENIWKRYQNTKEGHKVRRRLCRLVLSCHFKCPGALAIHDEQPKNKALKQQMMAIRELVYKLWSTLKSIWPIGKTKSRWYNTLTCECSCERRYQSLRDFDSYGTLKHGQARPRYGMASRRLKRDGNWRCALNLRHETRPD